ncbi:MAG: hypothetical protein ABR599_12365 [Gemmatimonadota bacterium]
MARGTPARAAPLAGARRLGLPAALITMATAAPAASQTPRDAAAAAWRLRTTAGADVGWDSNVFQADSARGDGYGRLGGTATLSRESSRHRLSGYAELNRKFYWELSQADEWQAYLDLTASRDLGRLLAGAGLRSAYVDRRYLDREGNLLPRKTFASFSNRLLAFADLRLARDLYAAAEGGYRLRDYEETSGLTSLDYGEWTAELGLTRYLPARLSVRLQGRLEERAYDQRLAADAGGFLDAGNPELRLRQVEGEARVRKRWGREGLLEAVVALRSSQDVFEDELSYGQRSLAVRARHDLSGTRLAVRGAVVGRDFDLRRSGTGEPLEENFVTFDAEVERPLLSGATARGAYSLFRRSANEAGGSYTIGTLQAGVAYEF